MFTREGPRYSGRRKKDGRQLMQDELFYGCSLSSAGLGPLLREWQNVIQTQLDGLQPLNGYGNGFFRPEDKKSLESMEEQHKSFCLQGTRPLVKLMNFMKKCLQAPVRHQYLCMG